ncbi:hypothetical protein YY92_08355 [Campylobacter fetus]|uniref:hypothetical protein n=1 Tax=Campylobacter fetus TaxID=196 RepID=UPI0011C7F77D|nr:hypothetical protein [Campylobacter fetus]EAJ1232600.1 hypothetical protein [Campylobacter fetus]EAK0414721.1 hypothetical protein [Campylobacter fetus]TXF09163.1 hypothetical protein FPD25_03250 [Campylobacter fetus subsp. fetus]
MRTKLSNIKGVIKKLECVYDNYAHKHAADLSKDVITDIITLLELQLKFIKGVLYELKQELKRR